MKEKEDKLRLVKQILVDDNVPSVSKDCVVPIINCAEATPKTTEGRSRRVSLSYITQFTFENIV